MPEPVRLLDPNRLHRNPENPRLIFRQDELESLEQSIADQGILVPLTVYDDSGKYFLLDGERRWRCSLKLGLPKVPVIVQQKPDRLTNLMMMFAIHNARKDWDPLPTALKLEQLEKEFTRRNDRLPKEVELAGIASLSRGEVRRLKKLLGLPQEYRDELIEELKRPKAEQQITVDHVLESTKAAESLRKRGVIDQGNEELLRRSLIRKFREDITQNTVGPRKLVKLAQAVQRNEVPVKAARRVVDRLITERKYTVDEAYSSTVEEADFQHSVEQLADRLLEKLNEHHRRKYQLSESASRQLRELGKAIRSVLKGD